MRIVLILSLTTLTHIAGCQSAPRTSTFPYSLQFIDAETHQPIQGVYIAGTVTGHYFNNRLTPANGRDLDVAPLSDADGKIILSLNSTLGIWHMLAVHKVGYEAMTGETHPKYNQWYLFYHTQEDLPAPTTGEIVELQTDTQSFITIRMRPIFQNGDRKNENANGTGVKSER